MGARLRAIFEEARAVGGLKGQFRLAMLMNIPSSRAALTPDTDDLVKKCTEALERILEEDREVSHDDRDEATL